MLLQGAKLPLPYSRQNCSNKKKKIGGTIAKIVMPSMHQKTDFS